MTLIGGTPSKSVSTVTIPGFADLAPALGRSASQSLPLSEANAICAALTSSTRRLTSLAPEPDFFAPILTTGTFGTIRRSIGRAWPPVIGVPFRASGTTLKPA
jgi:hypothetical protein